MIADSYYGVRAMSVRSPASYIIAPLLHEKNDLLQIVTERDVMHRNDNQSSYGQRAHKIRFLILKQKPALIILWVDNVARVPTQKRHHRQT